MATQNVRKLSWAFGLTAGFMLLEALGGWFSGSLALLADAGHMLVDSAALGLALVGMKLAQRKSDGKRTYGYQRFSILAAFVNAISLFVVVGFILVEAWERWSEPVSIMGEAMLVVAALGLVVNVVVFKMLSHTGSHGHSHHGHSQPHSHAHSHSSNQSENLNMKGALLHVMGDLLGSVGALVAGLVIVLTGWTPIDAILSVVVSLLILNSAWKLLRQSTHVLLEGAPETLDASDIKVQLCNNVPLIKDVHHLHLWNLGTEDTLATLHVRIESGDGHEQVLKDVHRVLKEQFHIQHSTIQIETDYCSDS